MGQLKDKHGFTLLGNIPSGTCPECAAAHDPQQPRNQQSLSYQYKYYDQHGRFPIWADAMAHCSDEVKEMWREALAEQGIEVNPAEGVAIEEIAITIEIRHKEETL